MGGLLSRLTEGVLRFFFVRPAPVAIEASNEPTQTKSVVRRKYESEEVTITSTSSGGSEPPQTDVTSDEGASILKEAENALDSAEGGVASPSDDQTVPEATGYDALPEPQQDYQPEPEPEVEHEAAPAEIPETETETGSDDVKEDMTSPTPIQSAVFEQASDGRLNVDEEQNASLENVGTADTMALGQLNLSLRPSDSESSQDFKDSVCGEAIGQEMKGKDSETDLRFVDSVATLICSEVQFKAEKSVNGKEDDQTTLQEVVEFSADSNCHQFPKSHNSETNLDFKDSVSDEINAQRDADIRKKTASKITLVDSFGEKPFTDLKMEATNTKSLGKTDSDTSLHYKDSVSEMNKTLPVGDTIKPSAALEDVQNTQPEIHKVTNPTCLHKNPQPSYSDSNLEFKDSSGGENLQQNSDEKLRLIQYAEKSVSEKGLQETTLEESEKESIGQLHLHQSDLDLGLHFQDSVSDVSVKQVIPEAKSKSCQQPPEAKKANSSQNSEVKPINDPDIESGIDSDKNLKFKGTVNEMEIPDYLAQNCTSNLAADSKAADKAKKSPPHSSSNNQATAEIELAACDKASEYELARDPFGSHPRIDRSNIDLNPQPAQSTSSLYFDTTANAPTSHLDDDVTNDVNVEEKKTIGDDKSCSPKLNLGDVVCKESEPIKATDHAPTSLPVDDVTTDVRAEEQQRQEVNIDSTDVVGKKAAGRKNGKSEFKPIKVLYSVEDESDQMVKHHGSSRDCGELVITSSISREQFDHGVVKEYYENLSDTNENALNHDGYCRDDFAVEPSYESYDQGIHSSICHHEKTASYNYGNLPSTVGRDEITLNRDNYDRYMESNHEIHEMPSAVKELDHEEISEMQNVMKYKHHDDDHELVGDAELSRELPRVIVREIHREVPDLVRVNWMDNHYEGMDTNVCQDMDVKMNQLRDITVKDSELCDAKSLVRVSVIENNEEIANGNEFHHQEASRNGFDENGESRTLVRVNLVETDESILHGNGYHEISGSQNGYHEQIDSQNGYHEQIGSQNDYHDDVYSPNVYHEKQQQSHHEIDKMAAEGSLGVVVASRSHQCQSSVARGSEKGPEMSDGDPDKRVEGEVTTTSAACEAGMSTRSLQRTSHKHHKHHKHKHKRRRSKPQHQSFDLARFLHESSSIPIDPQCECDRSKFTDENPHLVRRVTWFGPAENVYVTGSWLNWEKKIQLTNIGHDVWQADLCFKCVDDVSVELKFVVDTMWLTSPNMLTSESSIGSTNNIIYLRGSE